MADRRTVKTRKAIREVFLKLLKDKGIHRITVAEISRLADLGRGTFYLHYKDVYDLYEQIENEFFDGLGELLELYKPFDDAEGLLILTETITKYIAENRDIFLLLTQPESSGTSLRKLDELIGKKIVQAEQASDYDIMENAFIIYGIIGMLEKWLRGNHTISQAQLSAILHQILVKL